MEPCLDAIVVGAGVSGLAAGQELASNSCLIIDRAGAAGGRVETITLGGQNCDVGAVIGYDSNWISGFAGSPLIIEDNLLGLIVNDAIYEGAVPIACIEGWLRATTANESNEIETVRQLSSGTPLAPKLSAPLQEIIRRFFHVIHPGQYEAYAREVQADAFRRFYFSHHEKGNGELVNQLRANLSIRLNSCAIKIEPIDKAYRVLVRRRNKEEELFCRSIVVATTAVDAKTLMGAVAPAVSEKLELITYAPFLVVALALSELPLRKFSYLVAPQENSVLVILRTKNPEVHHLLLYFRGEQARFLRNHAPRALAQCALNLLQKAAGAKSNMPKVLDVAVRYWAEGGTVVSGETMAACMSGWDSHLPGVFIAGDYSWERCYGMKAGLLAGKRAGRAASRYIAGERSSNGIFQ